MCGTWGYDQFGWIGLAGGVLIGLPIGWVGGIAIAALMFFILIWPERMQQHRDMRQFFGRYWARNRISEWQTLTTKLSVGETVSGKVVASYYYGVFVDTGHSFPARLAVRFSGSGIDGPRQIVGDMVSASVREFDASERFIELTQVSQEHDSEECRPTSG